jgi:hypothetical protein
MKPWGFVHNGCCGLPIFNDKRSDQNEQSEQEVPNTESIDKRVKKLENLIDRSANSCIQFSFCLVNDTRKGNRYNRNNNRRDRDNSSNSDNNSNDSDNNSNDSDNNSRSNINNNTNNDNRR